MTIVRTETIQLGCEPDILTLTLLEISDGSLILQLEQPDDGAPMDLDGLFFNLVDDTTVEDLGIYPLVNDEPITGFETEADSVDTLANGAQVPGGFDAGIQFGTAPDSTSGMVNSAWMTLWSDAGPIGIDDIDLDSFSAVVDSDDGESGRVLTTSDGDGSGDGEEHEDDGTMSFLVEGDVNVQVTLTELENGDIQVDLDVQGEDDADGTGQIGDLRGFFFDLADDSLLSGISVSGVDVTGSDFESDGVSDLGHGANMNGYGTFDGGLSLGTAGIGHDDLQSTSFVISHADAALTLDDFAEQDFGLRLTSVGDPDGAREESLKLLGMSPETGEDCGCDSDQPVDYVDLIAGLTEEDDDAETLAMVDAEEEPDDFLMLA